MASLPYFALYPKDFLGDCKVDLMTPEELGGYFRLLCIAWQQQPPATLPSDETLLARWSKLGPERWKECRIAIMDCFSTTPDGRLQQGRLLTEHDKAHGLSAKRAAAGRAGAMAKWQKHGKRYATGLAKKWLTGSGSSSSSERSEEVFLEFWKAYPKKVGKPAARQALKKLGPDQETMKTILTALALHRDSAQWNKDGGQYIPNPTTWLNQRRWEDEIKCPTSHEAGKNGAYHGPPSVEATRAILEQQKAI